MKFEEMRSLDTKQLESHIATWKAELFKERVIVNRSKKAKKPHIFAQLKKQIARANTLINQNLSLEDRNA